jgi:hypothetical protein
MVCVVMPYPLHQLCNPGHEGQLCGPEIRPGKEFGGGSVTTAADCV